MTITSSLAHEILQGEQQLEEKLSEIRQSIRDGRSEQREIGLYISALIQYKKQISAELNTLTKKRKQITKQAQFFCPHGEENTKEKEEMQNATDDSQAVKEKAQCAAALALLALSADSAPLPKLDDDANTSSSLSSFVGGTRREAEIENAAYASSSLMQQPLKKRRADPCIHGNYLNGSYWQ